MREFEWSLAGEETLRPELQRETDLMLSALGQDPDHPFGAGYDLTPSDLKIVARSDIHEMLDESARVGCGETIDGFCRRHARPRVPRRVVGADDSRGHGRAARRWPFRHL